MTANGRSSQDPLSMSVADIFDEKPASENALHINIIERVRQLKLKG
jgi:hypothetical protein